MFWFCVLSLHDFDVKGDKLELDEKSLTLNYKSTLTCKIGLDTRPTVYTIDYANMTRIIVNLRNMTCVGFDFLKCKQCQWLDIAIHSVRIYATLFA